LTIRVHVVFTGGTIGSAPTGMSTDLVTDSDRQLLSFAPPGADVAFTHSSPFRILSEDATLGDWSRLAGHIAGLDLDRIDAVVVAHGSDTLAWTAKALNYALEGASTTVVMVGSDKPLTEPGSNGADNFRDAISFAATEKLPGVYVAWRNPGECTTIHLGSRLLPCDIHDDTFRSAKGLHFGEVSDGGFRRNAIEGNPSRSHLARMAEPIVGKAAMARASEGVEFSADVLVLPAMPGIPARRLFDAHPWKAVLQLAYHSGTASSLEGDQSLTELARNCRVSGIPLVVGPGRGSNAPYASIARLEDAGAVFAPSMSESALVVKLRWLLGTRQDLSALARPVGFDILDR
jgi:L-asparaginase/Glu-tRNA(Gln) amidotransferase subunit D